MFAVSRTANVPGRIKLLTVSIHTINDIEQLGFREVQGVQIYGWRY
jgi:hypothetical protein